MFYRLYSLSDIDMIVELKGNELSVSELDLYAEAFKSVEIYDELAFLRLRNVNDSLLGAAGDIVISVAGVNIVIVYALRDNAYENVKANDLVRHLVAGWGVGCGHDNMAGGFIPSKNMTQGRVPDTFLKHRAIGFYEKHGGRSGTCPA